MACRETEIEGSPEATWKGFSGKEIREAWTEEIHNHAITLEENKRLRNEIEAYRVRLLDYGEAQSELGLTPQSDPPASGLFSDDAPLAGCASFPKEVYESLPQVLAQTTGFYSRRHARDVCLLSSLGTLSSAMPKVQGWWGHDVPRPHGPNLYVAIVASAAGGKSAIGPARTLVSGVHRHIREQSDRARAEWEEARSIAQAAGDPFDKPKPPECRLWVPANTSQAFLMDRLAGQDGRGLVFSTEIDTWTSAAGQDWGQFDDFARKAYHHEASAQGRKSSGLIEIDNPHVSLVLAGTAGQFVKLIESPENGLYSRICLYHFDGDASFQSQRPSQIGIQRQEELKALADRVTEVYRELHGRVNPLVFGLTDEGWDHLQRPFADLHYEVQQHGYNNLVSIVRRAALWSFRIAMVLTVLRVHDEGGTLRQADRLEANPQHVRTATKIALVCAKHSLRFARAKLGLAQPAEPAGSPHCRDAERRIRALWKQRSLRRCKGGGIRHQRSSAPPRPQTSAKTRACRTAVEAHVA